MNITPEEVKELARHIVRNELIPKRDFDPNRYCFPEQVAFIQDPAKFKTAVCSRRSGKTIACAVDLVRTAQSKDRIVCLYITLSRNNAKKIIWPELLELNRSFRLNGQVNETDLSITFPNRSVIYCSGAKDKTEIEKFRGLALALCYIDESQAFKTYIEQLIDEVISKALFDHDGVLCLIGTPGAVPTGFFYDCAHSPEWSHHAWTMFQNPHLERKSGKTPRQLLQRELDRKGIGEEDPTIQRECFGRWVTDPNALVFRYDAARNHYVQLPKLHSFVLGVDLGWDDADAISVLGWSHHSKEVYLVEEVVKAKQGITELAGQISALIQTYSPLSVVMDTGGIGKKVAEEMQARYSLPIQAAEKSRKFEYIEFVNDALRTGQLFAKKDSHFAQDAMLLEWDREVDGRLKIADGFHSDAADSLLYAFRESLHWLSVPLLEKPKAGTPAFYAAQEDEMEKIAEDRLRDSKEDDIWGDLRA